MNVTTATPLITNPITLFSAFMAWMSVIPSVASIASITMPMPPPKYPPYTPTHSLSIVAPASALLLVSCSITDARPAPNLLPNANSSVAPSVIQGRTRMNVWAGVFSSRYAPARPPSKLTLNNGIMTRRGTSRRLRYAPPLAAAAVHNAIVLVALAGMGGTPVHNSAGKAMKLPPPATELSAPPTPPATNRKTMVSRVKLLGVPERARLRQLTPGPALTYFCYRVRETLPLLRG